MGCGNGFGLLNNDREHQNAVSKDSFRRKLVYVDCEAHVEYVKYLYYFGMTHCRSHVAPNFAHVQDRSAAKHAKTAFRPEKIRLVFASSGRNSKAGETCGIAVVARRTQRLISQDPTKSCRSLINAPGI